MRDLDEHTHEQIKELCEAGDELLDEDDFEGAVAQYEQALTLIPEPKTEWEAATWVYTALGDSYFALGDLPAALESLQQAVVSPDGLGNPFVHLRLGQVQYETGNAEKSADELARAYMGAGREIFEDEDPKYLDFLGTKMVLSD